MLISNICVDSLNIGLIIHIIPLSVHLFFLPSEGLMRLVNTDTWKLSFSVERFELTMEMDFSFLILVVVSSFEETLENLSGVFCVEY